MIALSGRRFAGQRLVGDSQAVQTLTGASQDGETRGKCSRRVNRVIKQRVGPFSAGTVSLKMVQRPGP
jgi:hypothetical protein